MNHPNAAEENNVFTIPSGTLDDVRGVAREMIASGETSRNFPVNSPAIFQISSDRAQMSMVLVEIDVDGTPIYIGRLQASASTQSTPAGIQ